MTEAARAGSEDTPVLFPAGDETLFGIVSHPTSQAAGWGVIVLTGGGTPLSTGVNRLSVHLCRRLATHGYHCMRFDYHGVGESTGLADRFRLDRPFTTDLDGAIQCMKEHGVNEFVLVGSCFGARTVLSCAARTPEVRDLVLVAVPVRDFEMGEKTPTRLAIHVSTWGYVRLALRPRVIRGLADPKARRVYAKAVRAKWKHLAARFRAGRPLGPDGWVSEGLLEELSKVVRRGTHVLVIHGLEDDFHKEFQLALSRRMGEILKSGSGTVQVRTLPGAVHGFTKMGAQLSVLELITDWVDQRRASYEARTISLADAHGIQLD
jgi:pimeloyl-ACP methyl ester carboxylesterase